MEYIHDEMTADAVRPVPTLRLLTMNVSVVLLSSPKCFFSVRVTRTMPGSHQSLVFWADFGIHTNGEDDSEAGDDAISDALRKSRWYGC